MLLHSKFFSSVLNWKLATHVCLWMSVLLFGSTLKLEHYKLFYDIRKNVTCKQKWFYSMFLFYFILQQVEVLVAFFLRSWIESLASVHMSVVPVGSTWTLEHCDLYLPTPLFSIWHQKKCDMQTNRILLLVLLLLTNFLSSMLKF